MPAEFRELFVSAFDGLRLYARDYGPVAGSELPVVCLPVLARTSADFHALGLAFSTDEARPRRVLALDYRGRGRSERDKDWRNYDVRVEFGDVLQVLTAAGIGEAVFVGTSRGGLITMALAAARPALIRAAVLNDIGPVIERSGLLRIRAYVGKLPQPSTFAEAAAILRKLSGGHFPGFSDEQWETLARGTWQEIEGRLVSSYDPNLLKTLEALDLDAPLPILWHLFEGLAHVPVMGIRGEHSDILSAATVEAMAGRHPSFTAAEAADQGHAPVLEGKMLEQVKSFVNEAA